MKTRHRSVPELAVPELGSGTRPERSITAEIDAVDDPAAEVPNARDRRVTLSSPIPALLAEEMRSRLGGGPDAEGTGPPKTGAASSRRRAAAFIDEARAALDAGEVTAAVTAAEGALRESDEAPYPGIVEVIEPARPLLARVFAAYVGPLHGVPVLAPRADEIARARLDGSERALLARVDGSRTLEQLFDGSGLGATDALRIAARLIRAGAVRVI